MDIYLKLLAVALVVVAVTVFVQILIKKTPFGKLSEPAKQVVIGFVFGGVAAFGTEFGVDVGGAVANVRDAAPLSAALIFGGPAGIIAGLVGGAERALAVMWGAGEYSVVACTVSTVLAGFLGAFLRKFMYDDRCPTSGIGLATAVVMEVVHLIILFLTHLEDAEKAYEIVRIVTVPMIVGNGVALALSIIAAEFFIYGGKKEKDGKREKLVTTLADKLQVHLLIVVVICYVITTGFVFILQTGSAVQDAGNTLEIVLTDVEADMQMEQELAGVSVDEALERVTRNRHVGTDGYVLVFDANDDYLYDSYRSGDANPIDVAHRLVNGSNLKDILSEVVVTAFSQTGEMEIFKANVNDELCFCEYRSIGNLKVMAVLPEDEVYEERDAGIYVNSFMEVIVFAIFFMCIYFMVKNIIVRRIRSVNGSLDRIIGGNLEEKVEAKGVREFEDLSADINSTVDTLKKYIDEANTRYAKELELAKNIQYSSLPSVFPPFPDRREIDVYALMDTAKEVGGDFYDFYMLRDDRLAFVVADVAGKGIPASLFMMRAKTMLKSLAETGIPVNEIFDRANEKLCEGNDADMFVTAWMGILDLGTGHVTFANAGHNPPLICHRDGEFEFKKSPAGFVLAGMPGMTYKMQEFDMLPGDRFVLYTDGVTEAMNGSDELYGNDRLKAFLDECGAKEGAARSPREVLEGLKKNLEEFSGEKEQFDDITMLMLDYYGREESGFVAQDFEASSKMLDEVTAFVTAQLERHNCPEKTKMQVSLALEEVFVNVAHYAYPDGVGSCEVAVKATDTRVILRFTDTGIPFNPLESGEVDVAEKTEDDSIGGLGIFMVKKMMDEVTYRFEDGKNILTVRKDFGSSLILKEEN